MKFLKIRMSGFEFKAKLESEKAPKTCEVFKKLLPIENGTSHLAKGEILLYPGYLNEQEIFIPYGGACFSSPVGQLPGSQFLTIIEGLENIEEVGRRVLWEGAQDITIENI